MRSCRSESIARLFQAHGRYGRVHPRAGYLRGTLPASKQKVRRANIRHEWTLLWTSHFVQE